MSRTRGRPFRVLHCIHAAVHCKDESRPRRLGYNLGRVLETRRRCVVREENSANGGGLFESVWRDVRYGFRVLRRRPGFTLAAGVTLGLGLVANRAIFSVIYGVLLRPLPYREGERLVVVRQQARLNNANSLGFSPKEFFDYRDQNQTMESMVEHHSMNL